MELQLPPIPPEKKTGGLFQKGSTPWNKGKKMPEYTKKKLKKTMFKKGNKPKQPETKTIPKTAKRVHMYSRKDKYIRTFETITEASRETGIVRRNIGQNAR